MHVILFLVLSIYLSEGTGVSQVPRPNPVRIVENGRCSVSIFDTRVPYAELVPEEAQTRLSMNPLKHPDRSVCGSFHGKESCCSTKTLQDLVAWSDMIDASMQVAKYTKFLIEKDPKLAVDQIIIVVRSSLPHPNTIDWKALRNDIRNDAGSLILQVWTTMFPEFTRLWAAMVTYQEGLLCSACQPDFSKYLDSQGNLKLSVAAPGEIADAVLNILEVYDRMMTDPTFSNRLKQLVIQICNKVGGGTTTCAPISAIWKLIENYITGNALRHMICGTKDQDRAAQNKACRDMVLNQVLRGLFTDVLVIIDNVFKYARYVCPQKVVKCDLIDTIRVSLDNALSFTFDERVIPQNVYVVDGFNIMDTACESNLSGYACGGAGPRPESHAGETPTGNNSGLIITIVVLLTLGSVGGVLFVSRHRIQRFTQTWYHRMRDNDSSGPTVGLV